MFLLGRSLLVTALAALAAAAHAAPESAQALRERHAQLAAQMEQSPFQRPLVVQSSDGGNALSGSVDAVMPQPFALAREHLQQPGALCEILMLQVNTKQCVVNGQELVVHIGRKNDQPLEDAYRVAFNLKPLASTDDYMSLRLGADSGPFSTRDFRIQLQAIPLDGGKRTYLHLGYSYGMGMAAKLAMQGYFATAGAGKVGFTRTGGDAYIGGMRGAIERNTMRYYLAIEAYLASLAAPAPQQRAQRLERWFSATEQYARQLHEVERGEYLAMKQREFRRLGA
ncbi:hypothetical protein [Piscinibacter gummiphilus]|uniref:Uncharacterized protein n=1 Tax=Piscinibacter gummiphilus TaxID=946333 RepID=A0ABZ0D7G0_9BURK|nr:hypothetical protein [Piscinibacter gummiphilus]WOB10978.1 hypothetical protein RXV79_04135 [Piscinibacter gummiphilus]